VFRKSDHRRKHRRPGQVARERRLFPRGLSDDNSAELKRRGRSHPCLIIKTATTILASRPELFFRNDSVAVDVEPIEGFGATFPFFPRNLFVVVRVKQKRDQAYRED
jgi:hypothetical protein